MRENTKSITRRMTGQIDKDMQSIRMNALGCSLIASVNQRSPHPHMALQPLGQIIFHGDGGIGVHLEPGLIQLGQQTLQKIPYRMVAKVTGHEADPKLAILWRGLPRCEFPDRLGGRPRAKKPRFTHPRFDSKRLHIVHGEEQITVRMKIVRLTVDRHLKTIHGFIEPLEVLKRNSPVVPGIRIF